jgi:hypothetical protein
MDTLDVFNDVTEGTLPTKTADSVAGNSYLSNLAGMQIGSGNQVFRGDGSGIWLGASKFEDAPFSVDMDGNVVATGLSLSGYLTKAGTDQVLGGNIIINDGTNDRILIGYQLNGF